MSDDAHEIIRTLLVEDDESLRKVLRRVIRSDGRLQVVGEARDGKEAVERARELDLDAILLDVRMPGVDGFEALPILRREAPEVAIVMLSMMQDPAQMERALLLGADGFVDKTTEAAKLVDEVTSYVHARRRHTEETASPSA